MRRFVFLALTGCSTAYTAEAPIQLNEVASIRQPAVHSSAAVIAGLQLDEPLQLERMDANAEYATEVLQAVGAHIVALPASERKLVADAMSMLVANCPYTRAKVMAMLALERELMTMDPSGMSVEGRERFAGLLRGVQAQASFYRSTGVDSLPMPLPSDFLASVGTTVDGPTFAASDNPIGLSMMSLEQVDVVLSDMPTQTQESIRASWDIIEPHVGDTIIFNFNELHTRSALRWLTKNEDVATHPSGLMMAVGLVEELGSHGC